MKPIEFPEQTDVIARNQKPYRPLPAFVNDEETVTCWALTFTERLVLLFTGKLWWRQKNFGQKLQPQCGSISYPFGVRDDR